MKLTNKLTILLAIATLCTSQVNGQKNHGKEALFDYKNEKYFEAKEKFKIAAEKEKKVPKKAMYLFLAGECYRQIVQPDQAEFYYKKALEADYKDPIVYWYLAESQREQANDKAKDKYKEAEKNFTLYFQKSGDKRGEKMAEACKKSQEWMANPTRHIITNEAVINSTDYDFTPMFMDRRNEVLLFASGRQGSAGAKTDAHTGDNFTDLWTTTRDKKGKWGEPQLLKEVINTSDNEGAGILDSKKETMYFTRCPKIAKKNIGCTICQTELKGKNWSEAVPVKGLKPEGPAGDSITIGHPALSKDNNVMIFAGDANMGGQGGKDLYMSTYDRRNKVWTTPVNLGPTINTSGDEMFPFLTQEGDLYFSSDGHLGMGGLDMFVSKKEGENKWGVPENLKYPMNSPQHDYGIIFDEQEGIKDRGFFSSNRTGTKGRDDIWSFVLPPVLFDLTVEVKNLDNDAPIADAVIKLVGTDNTSYEVKTDANGVFKFEIQGPDKRYINMNTTYTIEVSKKKFVTNDQNSSLKGQISTVGQLTSQQYYKVFKLREVTDKTVFHMPMVLYAYDKADLMIDPTGSAKGNDSKKPVNSKDSLNYLYDLMMKNPGWIVKLRSHTDQRGKDAYNKKLSLRRAQACVDYLVKEKGVDPRRLVAEGKGEEEPMPGCSETEIKALKTKEEQEIAYQKNRRTDFKIVGFDFDATKPQ
jgi:peptidoglycan-associated lipoprotein